MALVTGTKMAGHWQFSVSLMDREDFRIQLTRLVQLELERTVVRNK